MTVPVAEFPPTTLAGEIDRPARLPPAPPGPPEPGFTVKLAVTVLAEEAVIVAVVMVVTGEVEISKVALI